MTKEELYEKWSKNINAEYIIPTLDAFFSKNTVLPNQFFDSNVCIPKGATLQVGIGGIWEDEITLSEKFEYRIKPQEPVYEWQWLEDGKVQNLEFYIEDELEDYPNRVYQKIEETKRVRNA